MTKAEILLKEIKDIITREPFHGKNEKKSIQYLVNLDSRQHRAVVVVTKEWTIKEKLYATCAYFHIKHSWDASEIIFRINSMPGPGEQL